MLAHWQQWKASGDARDLCAAEAILRTALRGADHVRRAQPDNEDVQRFDRVWKALEARVARRLIGPVVN